MKLLIAVVMIIEAWLFYQIGREVQHRRNKAYNNALKELAADQQARCDQWRTAYEQLKREVF